MEINSADFVKLKRYQIWRSKFEEFITVRARRKENGQSSEFWEGRETEMMREECQKNEVTCMLLPWLSR